MTPRVPVVAWIVALIVPGAFPPGLVAQDIVPDSLAYIEGDPDAAVTVTEYLDFGCSACAAFAYSTLPELRREYIERGRVRWRMVPFVMGTFRHSAGAARAAWCADRQDRFQAMHDALFAQRDAWSRRGDPEDSLARLATGLGLDEQAFRTCYRSEAAEKRVEQQTRAVRRARIRATPTFELGDQMAQGALDAATFRQLLDAILRDRSL